VRGDLAVDRGQHFLRGEHREFPDNEVWVREHEIEFVGHDVVDLVGAAMPSSSEVQETVITSTQSETTIDATCPLPQPHRPGIPRSQQHTSQQQQPQLAELLTEHKDQCISRDTFPEHKDQCISRDTFPSLSKKNVRFLFMFKNVVSKNKSFVRFLFILKNIVAVLASRISFK
jgi:hypothetical protein